MRAFFYTLLLSFLLLGCGNPLPPPATDTILTNTQVSELIHSEGYNSMTELVLDSKYVVVSEKWYSDEFYPKYYKFLTEQGLDKYRNNTNDCDKFAEWARLYAQKLTNDTSDRGKASAAFGTIWYVADAGFGHAINFIIVSTESTNKFKVVLFEPQTGFKKTLSNKEKDNVSGWAL